MYEIVGYLLVPSNLITLLAASGVLLYLIKRSRRAARYILTGAGVMYVMFAAGPVSSWLLGRLEYKYPYLKEAALSRTIDSIVVLAAYSDDDQNLPLSSRVNSSAAFRLMEALRIARRLPNATIMISGSKRVSGVMKDVLVSMGMEETLTLIEDGSPNTVESARNVKRMVGDRKIILVTSAGHMPRAMMVFRKAGMDPIPAPTDYLTYRNYLAISYLPSPLHLQNSDLAVHEYVGMLWYKIQGHI